MRPPFWFVFDVESAGLHGPAVAVGWVVVTAGGIELDSDGIVLPRDIWGGAEADRKWLDENANFDECRQGSYYTHQERMQRDFWWSWKEWRGRGAMMAADCVWPVEANFLSACIRAWDKEMVGEAPYPLVDIPSVLLSLGKDPIKERERIEGEMPKHNPVADARQSARILIKALDGKLAD